MFRRFSKADAPPAPSIDTDHGQVLKTIRAKAPVIELPEVAAEVQRDQKRRHKLLDVKIDLHRKLLFGTDFPIPVATPRLWRDLGSRYRTIAKIESWPQRAAEICATLGFSETVFTQAAELLPNVEYFASRAATHAS